MINGCVGSTSPHGVFLYHYTEGASYPKAMELPGDQRLLEYPKRITNVDVPIGQPLVYKAFSQ